MLAPCPYSTCANAATMPRRSGHETSSVARLEGAASMCHLYPNRLELHATRPRLLPLLVLACRDPIPFAKGTREGARVGEAQQKRQLGEAHAGRVQVALDQLPARIVDELAPGPLL